MTEIDQAVATALEIHAGHPIVIMARRPLGGGCISQTEQLRTTAGTFVLKSSASAPAGFFRGEADGLTALRSSGTTLTIPRVIACSSDRPQWIVIEYLSSATRQSRFDDALGWGLASLHRASAKAFGFEASSYCGLTSQPNSWNARWVDFYAESRLGHQLALARNGRLVDAADTRRIGALISRLGHWIGEPPEGPALVHGDLWSGNLHVDACGGPALIDPAAYYAHREAELGMMTLFGGFGGRVFEAYDEAFPLEPGWRDRNPLYQLYHLLNHLNLFGAGYHGQVMGIVGRYA